MIVERSGVANTAEPWEWHCGFYPGGRPGEQRYGRAASFEAARASFEAAWRDYLPKCTDADFEAWRDQEARTTEKYRSFDSRERMLAEFSYLGGISADKLAASMLKYTIECMTIAITSAQVISTSTFELRACIL
jgi:hypothetical protein